MTFPIDLDIFLPFSSTTKPCTNNDLGMNVSINTKTEKSTYKYKKYNNILPKW